MNLIIIFQRLNPYKYEEFIKVCHPISQIKRSSSTSRVKKQLTLDGGKKKNFW